MLNVIYEDNSIVVVSKPCNVPVAPDSSKDEDLLGMVKQYIKEKYNKPGEAFIGMVHRLDRPAGGLVVFARNSKSAERLSKQIRDHEMKRTYYAVVRGCPKNKEGNLVNWLVKDEKTNTVSVVPQSSEGAKRAELDYKVLQTVTSGEKSLSLVEVHLQTGRAHQIRVQMAHLGCPLWGDQRYGASVNKRGQQLALWAVGLSFIHPIAKDKRTFLCYPQTENPWQLFNIDLAPSCKD